jgi:energy-coupling factor transporter ATP-binding protein EcfA2
VSRRKARLSAQMSDLAAALEALDGPGPDHGLVAPLARAIRRFVIPRLSDPPPPLVVAVVGPTGSGKSTLVNSVAGSLVSQPGVLRPTTAEPVVWTSTAHAGRSWPGKVVVSDHPLAASVALIDTPDLDSDLVEHRSRAIEVIRAADAAVFVTTSSRYGDASPWEVLRSMAGRPLVVVVNRLQTRASGARNDLAARLRAEGMGSVQVLTISEQRIDPDRGRLSHQSVQRLAGVLREWATRISDLRPQVLDYVSDEVVLGLRRLLEHLDGQAAAATRAAKEIEAGYEAGGQALESIAQSSTRAKRKWRRLGRRPDSEDLLRRMVEAVDLAASLAAVALETEGVAVSPDLRSAATATVTALARHLHDQVEPVREEMRRILDEDRRRFLDRLVFVPDEVLERVRRGTELIEDLDWRNV